MPEGLGFKAWLSTENDEALPEFGLHTSLEKREIQCWIPSEAGKRFKVCWQKVDALTVDATCGFVKVDGTGVGGLIAYRNEFLPMVKDSVRTSESTYRHFLFSPLQLSDDDLFLNTSSAQNLGEIELSVWEVLVGNDTPILDFPVSAKTIVHEKSKKGLAHSIGFGPELTLKTKIAQKHIDAIKVLVTFVFKYRPFDILRANGIVPPRPQPIRMPSPPQLPLGPVKKRKIKEEDDVAFEAEKELEFHRARVRELEARCANVKRVKTEPRPAFLSGEVIDLT
ncbi:hypothetical protein BDQ17DRAFT_1426518 [Cyathus striatus]|nr:hypothetical protein BDQ17DRAFT_1426518 [Cyathus striatus]